jgi:DNA-directed RNA polymerase subunit RPC12/RpoP
MKKRFILLLIIMAGVFIASCERGSVTYCPYCSYAIISQVEPGVYKCARDSCGKTFGATEIKAVPAGL